MGDRVVGQVECVAAEGGTSVLVAGGYGVLGQGAPSFGGIGVGGGTTGARGF
jgi:hypothetical protein